MSNNHPQIYSYTRSLGSEQYLIMVNLTKYPAEYSLPEEANQPWQLMLANQHNTSFEKEGALAPYEARLYQNARQV